MEFLGFVRGLWVHWVSPWRSSDSFCVAGFIGVCPWVCRVRWEFPGSVCPGSFGSFGVFGVRPGGRRVYLVSLGLLGFTLGDVGFAGFIGLRSWDSWVLSGSLGSLGCALGVLGIVQCRWVDLGGP